MEKNPSFIDYANKYNQLLHAFTNRMKTLRAKTDKCEVIDTQTARVISLCHSILKLQEEGAKEDAHILLRALMERYLTLEYLIRTGTYENFITHSMETVAKEVDRVLGTPSLREMVTEEKAHEIKEHQRERRKILKERGPSNWKPPRIDEMVGTGDASERTKQWYRTLSAGYVHPNFHEGHRILAEFINIYGNELDHDLLDTTVGITEATCKIAILALQGKRGK